MSRPSETSNSRTVNPSSAAHSLVLSGQALAPEYGNFIAPLQIIAHTRTVNVVGFFDLGVE